jgi:plasmid stabilization system protein ParE
VPESREFDRPIRELFYGFGNRGTYRILFTIIDRTVFVLHVRHGSMQPLLTED